MISEAHFTVGQEIVLHFAYSTGSFDDMEDAKYRMLEDDDAPLPPTDKEREDKK